MSDEIRIVNEDQIDDRLDQSGMVSVLVFPLTRKFSPSPPLGTELRQPPLEPALATPP
ncbi:MAG: hypothetical protein KAV87_60600 [Desulfobacteraceae bacterium]|nr:hypothetical protein [Desulfobacteraceae bacterium]